MVGNYMDAPAQRLAWDRNAIAVWRKLDGTLQTLTQADRRNLNNETNDYLIPPNNGTYLVVLLPSPVNLRGVLFSSAGTAGVVMTSKDTSNGLDGSWSLVGTTNIGETGISPKYRVAENVLHLTPDLNTNGVTAVAVSVPGGQASSRTYSLHLYAEPIPAQIGDGLLLWQDVADLMVTPTWFDFGDVPRETSAERSFRVKNCSASNRALAVGLFVEALTDGSPSFVDDFLFSADDGLTWLPALALGDMPAGGLSGVLRVRRVTPSNAALSTYSVRIVAEATGWGV